MAKAAASVANRARLTLAINGIDYIVRPVARGSLTGGIIRAFRLTRLDRKLGTVTYRISQSSRWLSCDCGDFRYRQGPTQSACKHLAAARACGLL